MTKAVKALCARWRAEGHSALADELTNVMRHEASRAVKAGLIRARLNGKILGRPRKNRPPEHIAGLSVRAAASRWGVSKSTAARWIDECRHTDLLLDPLFIELRKIAHGR